MCVTVRGSGTETFGCVVAEITSSQQAHASQSPGAVVWTRAGRCECRYLPAACPRSSWNQLRTTINCVEAAVRSAFTIRNRLPSGATS